MPAPHGKTIESTIEAINADSQPNMSENPPIDMTIETAKQWKYSQLRVNQGIWHHQKH